MAEPGTTQDGFDVPVVTLDDEIHEPEILLMKVDTEHYELMVLKGAGQVLARTRFLILEVHRPEQLATIQTHLGPAWSCRRLTAADYLFTQASHR